MKKTKKEILNEQQKKEIFYNIVNSVLSGSLVFLGTIVGAGFEFSLKGVFVAIGISIMVCVTKFKSYWDEESSEYSKKLFNYISY